MYIQTNIHISYALGLEIILKSALQILEIVKKSRAHMSAKGCLFLLKIKVNDPVFIFFFLISVKTTFKCTL